MQDALNALGYTTNTLDGIFGHATENALKACQRRFGLTADGVCGCASWKKIAEATVEMCIRDRARTVPVGSLQSVWRA